MKNGLKVLLLFDSPFYAPRGYDFKEEFKDLNWMTEDDVNKALKQCGYEVSMVGLHNDIRVLLDEIKEYKPDVVFNLADVFNQKSHLDKNVAAFLEMLDVPYTGATPAGLVLCGNKALTKEILSFHKIRVPRFHTFYRGKKVKLIKKLKLPLIVKPLMEEASRGISSASVADNEDAFLERVKFIHEKMNNDVIVEEYIEGRELYVSILGDKKITVLPGARLCG